MKIKDKKINKKDIIIFAITFVITCVIFIPLLTGHYASDTYNIANIGYETYAIRYSLNDGRIFMAIIGLIAGKLNMPIEVYSFITLFFALIISNLAVIVLKKVIEKYKKPESIMQEVLVTIISYVTIFNFMYLENLYFVENIVMSISILLFIISADIIVQKNKNHILKSMILTILGVMCYQGTIGLFFAFVFLFAILKNKNDVKQIIIDFIKGGVIGVLAVGIDLLIVKIVGSIIGMDQTRYGKISNIPKNVYVILGTLPNVLQECCDLFPKNLLFVFLGIITVSIIIYEIKNMNVKGINSKNKNENYILYKFLAIFFITVLSSSVVNITTLSSFNTGRLRNSLGALMGIIFIFLYTETPILKEKSKMQLVTIITLISFAIINFVNCESIMIEHKRVNELEKIEVEKIDAYIDQYEKDTGIEVTKVVKVFLNGRKSRVYFSEIKNKSVFAYNSTRVSWAADGVINFYTDRNLKSVKITKKEDEEYKAHQDEQRGYECIGDTLYINVYLT